MKKILLMCLFYAFFFQLRGEEKTDFNIIIPDTQIENSKYNKIRYIEHRVNPDIMGVVFVNNWHGYKDVTLPVALDDQLNALIEAITDPSPGLKTLAVQARIFNFDIGTDEFSGKDVCNLRMTLYEMDGEDTYYYLNTMDTVVAASHKEIREEASKAIVTFITENIPYHAYEDEEAMDIEKLFDIDAYEKNKVPFYLDKQIPDGIYYKYGSLKKLTPDVATAVNIVKGKDKKLKEVRIPGKEDAGKEKKLRAKDVYAVVKGGVPYISFNGGFYEAYFDNGDWFFTTVQKVAGSGFSLGIGVGVGGRNSAGGVGIGIPIGGKKENVDIYIDYLNGKFY